jgi:predicted DNA-binding ribbon-helix-helix protein
MLEKRSLSLSGHRTSVALEPEFWAALGRLATAVKLSQTALIAQIDEARAPQDRLASALRVYVLNNNRSRNSQA